MAAFWATIFFSQNKKTVKDYPLKGLFLFSVIRQTPLFSRHAYEVF